MGNRPVVLGITSGDPAGIGPEVALKALGHINDKKIIPILIGRPASLEKNYPNLLKNYTQVSTLELLSQTIKPGNKILYAIDMALPLPAPGMGNADTGLEARLYIDASIDLWRAGFIDAIVTGPVNKGHIEESGCSFSGHTEYLAQKIGEKHPAMLMYSDKYRVLLVTTHIPVRDIEKSISSDLIYQRIKTGHRIMSSIDGVNPRLAIAGLDPHCGENGAINDFDMHCTIPAVQRAVKEGIDVHGPFAADTLFLPERWKTYNLVIAHYHDQGLTPFKMLAFDRGVNVTLDLSLIRTSVDHGTAYDIAGTGKAGFQSMVAAIELAAKLVRM